MAQSFTDRDLSGMTIVLDDKRFVRCKLVQCRLIFKGGKLPVFRDTQLIDCNFVMQDAAASTLAFMGLLYRNGERSLVESLMAQLSGQVGPTQLPPLPQAPAGGTAEAN